MIKGNFRKLVIQSGLVVFGGKNAEMNEKVIEQSGKNEYVLHTMAPGSPFCNIKEESKKVSEKDLYETAIFCAKYSQAWKKSKVKRDIEVHVFLGKDIFKQEDMKTGAFGVKKVKTIIVKKEDLINNE